MNCGCKITCRFDGVGQSEYDGEIVFCPLHAAAEEMIGALKGLRGSINLILNRYAHDLRDTEKEIFIVANKIAGNIIAKAEGRHE